MHGLCLKVAFVSLGLYLVLRSALEFVRRQEHGYGAGGNLGCSAVIIFPLIVVSLLLFAIWLAWLWE